MIALSRVTALIAAIWVLIGFAWAQQPDPHAEDRKQLRAMLAEFEAAINAQSIERMVAEMDDNVTVIWLNAEVSRGKDEVRAYYGRMVGHDKAILKKYLTKATIGAPAKFYGDVAIANGSTVDEFYPIARGFFTLDSRWSTTVAVMYIVVAGKRSTSNAPGVHAASGWAHSFSVTWWKMRRF